MRYNLKFKADDIGKLVLNSIRSNPEIKKDFKIRVRANGKRKIHAIADGLGARGYDQDLPIRYATEYRVYLIKKGERV
tara:strand:+ start:855 stop:1088 length:234 start_codon:yes stop_codon:yes gene_type:complete